MVPVMLLTVPQAPLVAVLTVYTYVPSLVPCPLIVNMPGSLEFVTLPDKLLFGYNFVKFFAIIGQLCLQNLPRLYYFRVSLNTRYFTLKEAINNFTIDFIYVKVLLFLFFV